MRELIVASLLLMSLSCRRDKGEPNGAPPPKQTDLYKDVWEQFHKAPPTTLDKVQLLLGSKGYCGRETLYVVCEWSVPAPTAAKRIQVACDDDKATSLVRYAVFPDEIDRQMFVPVAKCSCEAGDPLCAEIPGMTCAPP